MQGTTSSPSIYSIALRPVRLLLQLTGAVPFICLQPNARWLLYELLTGLHLIICTVLVLVLSYFHIAFVDNIYQRETDTLSHGLDAGVFTVLLMVKKPFCVPCLDVFGMWTLAWAHLVVQAESTVKAQRYKAIFRKFEAIRGQLTQQLQRVVDCGSIARHRRQLDAFYALYFIMMGVVHYALYKEEKMSMSLICSLLSEFVIALKLFEFMLFAVVVLVLQRELQASGEHFRSEVQQQQQEQRSLSRVHFARIFVLQDLHAELWSSVRLIEDYFEWSLPAVLIKNIVDNMLLSYWFYLSCTVADINVWIKIYCVVFITLQLLAVIVAFFIASACERMHRKFRALFLDAAFDDGDRPDVDMCIRDLRLQMMHEPIRFTAGEFLVINRNTLGRFVSAQILLIVILIQFGTTF